MPTFTALTTLTDKAQAEGLSEAMERLDPAPMGVGAFELEDGSGLWEVGGYFTEAPDTAGLSLLEVLFGAKPFAISELPETDWVAKVRRELAPVTAGRFFVYGSHDADAVPENALALLIDAAMAFGTGHHGTTLGCLQALEELAAEGVEARNTVDIGCGTAVLAMAAAKLWPAPVLASDIDQVAVDVAETNIRANGLEGRVHCVEAAGFDHAELIARAPYDLVFANILKGPLIALAPNMAEFMAQDGRAILSGILNEQADDVVAHYSRSGINLIKRYEIGEWTTLVLQKQ